MEQLLQQFARQNGFISILSNDELKLFERLFHYHKPSAIHCVNVANDVLYVARELNYSKEDCKNLYVAALLHDVGKLNMHQIVLKTSINKNEATRIITWKGCDVGHDNPLNQISLRDLIDYRSSQSLLSRNFIGKQKAETYKAQLGLKLDTSVLEHIRSHQNDTKLLLEHVGALPDVVAIASHHHMEYFDKNEFINSGKLKYFATILDICDKFNAIIQSEGIRRYAAASSRGEALEILIKSEFDEFSIKVEKIIAKRYLPLDATETLAILNNVNQNPDWKNKTTSKTKWNILSRCISFLDVRKRLDLSNTLPDYEIKDKFDLIFDDK